MKPNPPNEPAIFTIRDQRVVLDAGLARICGVPTKQFNQAFKRNRHRFPDDFAFQLTAEEVAALRSQSVTLNASGAVDEGLAPNWSQFATGSGKFHKAPHSHLP